MRSKRTASDRKDRLNALRRCINYCGSRVAFRDKMNEEIRDHFRVVKPITSKHIYRWLNQDYQVPANYALIAARAAEWSVTPEELRPDIFANLGWLFGGTPRWEKKGSGTKSANS